MRTATLPSTDLDVSAICLGTSDIGSKIERRRSFRMLDQFLELGGTFIDTASVYANWLPGPESISEKTIGEWLSSSGKRDRVVLATKGAHPDLRTMHVSRLSRAEIVSDLDSSLRNLRTDVIDLYWLHRDDVRRPVGEILETLNEQVQAGKIRYFGCSNWTAQRIREAQDHAAAHGLQGFAGDQMMWSLAVIDRSAIADTTIVGMDDELRRLHVTSGLAAIPYTSQANGLFQKMAAGVAGRMSPNQQAVYASPENQARFERVMALARELSTTVTAIVLGYLQAQPFTTVPIVGCQSPQQLADSAAAGDVLLTPEQAAYLEGAAT